MWARQDSAEQWARSIAPTVTRPCVGSASRSRSAAIVLLPPPLGPEVPQRQVELGGEHEHGQTSLEADSALDQADADGDGHERDPDGRGELEHGAREERDPKRAHRRAAVLLAHGADPLCL
jgi:hypothetical protein